MVMEVVLVVEVMLMFLEFLYVGGRDWKIVSKSMKAKNMGEADLSLSSCVLMIWCYATH